MNQQETIDALAEQNRLLKEALSYCVEDSRYVLTTIETNYGSVHGERKIKAQQADIDRAVFALALPDLSPSILNQRDIKILSEAIGVCEELLLGRSTFSTDEIFGIRCCIRGIERLAAEKEK